RCGEMVAHARPDGAPMALTVYPGVYYNFDVALLTPGIRFGGYWLEYNELAAKDAEEKTRAFLAAHFAETSPSEPTARWERPCGPKSRRRLGWMLTIQIKI